ncbi:phosphotransferase family protein [Candidatus Chazhemtobacterium aquaticus]|uniref:Aminoglycoside phosphotransferase domain-containing protein n=1 Tax=Candidatus Chazhemtobacterium aquaticus TaxID=2715735 RepID=A0A857N4V6_9BACT|nr:hypothetical protein [Candidatus Chazhemtobacterium aquaticus]QHO63157.1 hypothetical protein MICH65_0176 [Candidatus Chazhemtobacterium aquaticus]
MLEMVERQVSRIVNLPKLKEANFSSEIEVRPGSPFYVCVLEKEDGEKIILKMGTPGRVKKEVEGYGLVPEIFPKPKILSVSNWGIEYEFFEGEELFDLVRGDRQEAFQTYQDYVDRTMALWTGNMRKAGEEKTVYDHRRLTEKTLKKIGKSLESGKVGFAGDQPMVINGREYPSLKDTFGLAVSLVGEPEEIVLDTGDANGSNILIAQDGRWVLIDFEKAGWYDPAYIIARQIGQWALTVNDPNDVSCSYSLRGNKNVIEYSADVPNLVSLMETEAMVLGSYLTSVGDNSWKQRAACYQLVFLSRMAVLSSSRFYSLLRQKDLSKVVMAKAVEGFYQLID